ncbi:DJ-1/PfpI family protein [Methylomonas sp. DH-1]|uniref:DJ-1/PfpI family protein n=1 Tax=Methylomonas sp. (strain DH-1) TaxID=1727196 RepID=UPI0018D36365|nr:DJ-1/PfpI family protein [Methylomonas sp. DH-1]
MTKPLPPAGPDPRHVSLVALPDAVISTLTGIFDVMNAFALTDMLNTGVGAREPFQVEIVGEAVGPLQLASGIPINVQRAFADIETTDIVIVPSLLLRPGGWEKGRYPKLLDWVRSMYQRGAVLCSACSGLFLLAETDCSMARTRRCTSATHGRSRPSIPPCRFTRIACWSSPAGAKSWCAPAHRRAGTTWCFT